MQLVRHSLSVTFLVCLALTEPALALPIVDLGTLGGPESFGLGVNDSGQVVGYAYEPDLTSRAFLYSGGMMTNLGLLPGGTTSMAVGINTSGLVLGRGDVAGGYTHGFLYSGGALMDIGTLGGTTCQVRDFNDAGQVVGSSLTASGEERAFLYSGGVMTNLGTLGGDFSVAAAINELGEIVGSSSTANGKIHAFRYSAGVMTDLGALGALQAWPTDINDAGKIVGWLLLDPSGIDVFVVDGGGMTKIEELGSPLGSQSTSPVLINNAGDIVTGASSRGAVLYKDGSITELGIFYSAINDAGQVVGYRQPSPAVVFSKGATTDLETAVGGSYGYAGDVSETGWIAGTFTHSNGKRHAFVRAPLCGDGVVDPAEECDDWNTQDGDCCASDCTYTGPVESCLDSTKSSLHVRNRDRDYKDSFKWRWEGTGNLTHADLGDPGSTSTYTLCVSDSTGGSDRLVSTMQLAPGANWTERSTAGWSYRDEYLLDDNGVETARVSLSNSGRMRVRLNARTLSLPLPPPSSSSEFFDQDSRVTVQLFNDATSACWSSEFTTAKLNTPERFQVKAP